MLNFYKLSYYQNLFSETIPNSTSIDNLILIISIIMASIIAISIVVFIIVKIKRKNKNKQQFRNNKTPKDTYISNNKNDFDFFDIPPKKRNSTDPFDLNGNNNYQDECDDDKKPSNCPGCGAPMEGNEKFCPYCGKRFL